MKRGLVVLIIIAVLALLVGGRLVGSYNTLVNMRTQVQTAFAEVDNQLQRRSDLIPNLVETVKGFAAQEQEVFGTIAAARAQLAGARTPQDKIAAGQAMDSALGRLLVVIENYPQLRSSENFMRLQDELAGTENRLSVARGRYNETTGTYNAMIQRFPTNLFANMLGFKAEPFYPVSTEARQRPNVDFGDVRSRDATPAQPQAPQPQP
jgi:LemA protein